MKLLQVLIFTTLSFSASAQKEITATTEKFSIEGRVKKEMTVSLTDLSIYKTYTIDSVIITNHLKARKSTLKKVKGVRLKDILAKIEIDAENLKVLNEYYFVFIASDNYKVVFSWNEIFNNNSGKSFYIITGESGKPASALDSHIALICPGDENTGRRYIKGLQKITVERVK